MVSKNGRYAFCLSKPGRFLFCLSKTGRYPVLPFEDWQVYSRPVEGLAGLLSACQGTGRYSFCQSRDWQVCVFAL